MMITSPCATAAMSFLSGAAVRLIVWCKACQHPVEPDAAEMAARYGAETSMLDWHEGLVCSQCGRRGSSGLWWNAA
jgi:hypothetical protein